jgi:cysteinyl-tRNA synthetase
VKNAKDQLTESSLKKIHETNHFVAEVLGLINKNPEEVLKQFQQNEQNTSASGVDVAWIEQLIEERKVAKSSKNWARADEIRNELTAKKIVLKDNPDGSSQWKIQT